MNIRPTKGDAVTTRYCAAMTRDQTGNIQVVTLFAFLLQTTRSLTKKALHTRLDMADPVRRTLTYNALETNAKKEQQQNDYSRRAEVQGFFTSWAQYRAPQQ